MKEFIKDLLKELKPGKDITKIKNKLSRKYKLKQIPKNLELLNLLNAKEKTIYGKYFITKPVRTLSGVAPIAIMTKPIKCPHGKCIMCPGGPDSFYGNVPQSYTGKEPATMRAIRNQFDPYLQVMNRLEHFIVLGQIPEKVELIIMGGTFPSFNKKYQEEFVKYAFKAMNDFSKLFYNKEFDFEKFKRFFELPGNVGDISRTEKIQYKLKKLKGKCSLLNEQIKNETSKIKCVGLTIETRPDFGLLKQGNEMLKLGCTRIELGAQSVYDDVLKKINRGHTTKDTIKSIRILKDLGFKINLHYMPGLPLTNIKKDLEGMKKLFLESDYRPDMLKIYPCAVIKGTKLYKEWRKGNYKPLTLEEVSYLIFQFKKIIPPYCRIMRLQRDISSKEIEAGVKMTNLRQYIHDKYKSKCKCIHCREIGHSLKNIKINIKDIKIKINHYKSSKGEEFFISAEDIKNNILFGYCRLRFPSQILRKEITKTTGLIRELHIYSQAISIGKTSKISFQHRGLGKKLLETAEKISKEHKKDKIVIISGIGVRQYFRKFGYKREGPYMTKNLDR